jgi:hypothetical protein
MEIILQIFALVKMVLDASKSNPSSDAKKISQFIAHENGFGCIQNQSLDRCKQISQIIAHENGFGCVQNQSYWKMEIILRILALMKMVLDASKTNP